MPPQERSCLTWVRAPAGGLLKEGSQNLLVLCVLCWIWLRWLYLQFEGLSAEGQTGLRQSKNNHTELQSREIVHCILSCSGNCSDQSLAVNGAAVISVSSFRERLLLTGEPWSFSYKIHEVKTKQAGSRFSEVRLKGEILMCVYVMLR